MSAQVISFQMILPAECTEDQLVSIATFFSWIWKPNRGDRRVSDTLSGYPNLLLGVRLWLGECLWGINTNVGRLLPKSSLLVQLKISTVVFFSFRDRALSITISQVTLATINTCLIFQPVRSLTVHKSNVICFFRSTISERTLNSFFQIQTWSRIITKSSVQLSRKLNNTSDIRHQTTSSGETLLLQKKLQSFPCVYIQREIFQPGEIVWRIVWCYWKLLESCHQHQHRW